MFKRIVFMVATMMASMVLSMGVYAQDGGDVIIQTPPTPVERTIVRPTIMAGNGADFTPDPTRTTDPVIVA